MRSVLFSLGLTFAVTLPCHAQEAKPNTLTPKEIADGWILLFDGATTFGWKASSSEAGRTPTLKAQDGGLGLMGGHSSAEFATHFSSFEMEVEYLAKGSGKSLAGLAIYSRNAKGENTSVSLSLFESVGKDWGRLKVRVHPDVGLRRWRQSAATSPLETETFVWLKNTYRSEIRFDPAGAKDSKLFLRNIKLRPLNAQSIFNGKDLSGWKVFPGDKYKSKFAVTDKGELNVKDGPGDLQTTGKYQNFILQLECISHGKNLNSGIFFRCRDNEYQNGYEAQIRNQFTAEATQDYVIEEYDPKTNKLVEKKKFKSTAVDYGTGAIYRRQPARKEMAKDGEWFSMTIIANGNHIATWVNGVQVTDWTDNRPVSDNARTGQKLDAGHISIQGHDPTTNLSFRNLRIVELPGTK